LSESGKDSPQPREFQPVKDAQEAHKLLREAVRSIASTMIWTKEQKHVLATNLRVFDEREKKLYARIPSGTDPEWFVGELDKMGSRECFFSVSLAKANVFFKAACGGVFDEGLQFSLPERLYKVQRRKQARFMVPFGRVMKVELADPLFPAGKLSKKIFDISSGGLAFIVDEEEGAAFQVGLLIEGMNFLVRGRRIKAEAEVRHLKTMARDSATPGVKVGVMFKAIDPGDAQWIDAYVFEESRKYFTKMG
jgi:hypothetical protein